MKQEERDILYNISNLIDVVSINAGQAHDITAARALLKGRQVDAVLISKACDSNDLRDQIAQMEAQMVIPSKRNRKVFIPHDIQLYKQRNRIRAML